MPISILGDVQNIGQERRAFAIRGMRWLSRGKISILDEEWLVRNQRLLLPDPVDRLVRHVFHQVVAFRDPSRHRELSPCVVDPELEVLFVVCCLLNS
jgi:hypothetical protein